MATVKELASLSNAVYSGAKTMGAWTAIRWSSDSGDLKTGLQAIVYQHATTEEIVLVVAGTALSDGADLGNDRDISNGLLPTQFAAIEAFYDETNSYLSGKGEKINAATGHSLGGADVSYLGYLYPELEVYSFNGPGIGHIKVWANEQNAAGETVLVEKTIAEALTPENNINTYIITADMVSDVGDHIGEKKYFDFKMAGETIFNMFGESGLVFAFYVHSIERWLDGSISYDDNGNPIGGSPDGGGSSGDSGSGSGGSGSGSTSGGSGFSDWFSGGGLGDRFAKWFGPFSGTPMGKFMGWLPFIPFFFNPNNPLDVPANVDPIILDLSKDGIKTTTLDRSAHFDYDGNGFAESTAWVSSTDGLLVMDRDGNGIIDTGKELFGDQTILANGKKAVHGFQALAELDENGDGKIDANDAAWSKLKVWIDNGDGINKEGELKTLDELGIKSLNLTKTDVNLVDEQGNTKTHSGTFEWNDGIISEMSNYLLKTDNVNTVATNKVAVSDEIKQLAYLPGYGNVNDSWQLMMAETDGKVKGLLESYASETDSSVRNTILDQILYEMTGSENIDPKSRGSYINAQKLAVVEKLYNAKFNNGNSPNSWAAPMLNSFYENVKKYYSGWLALQIDERALLKDVKFTFDMDNKQIHIDFEKVKETLQNSISVDFAAGKQSLTNFVNGMWSLGVANSAEFHSLCQEFISQSDELALAIYSIGRNVINGTSSNDTIYSQAYNEILIGGAGNDRLEAHGGDVVLSGGTGEDVLYGSKGTDEYRWGKGTSNGNVTYLWNKGDGNDTIVNAVAINNSTNAGYSRINFGVGITADDLLLNSFDNNLQIVNKTTKESLTIKNWFVNEDYKIDEIHFADGTVWKQADVEKLAIATYTAGDDVLKASYDKEYEIFGGGGNDQLYGNNRNDILDGGVGDDYLQGGYGMDTYIWGIGGGNDTIVAYENSENASLETVKFGEGITTDSLEYIEGAENSLVLRNKKTGDTLTLKNHFTGSYYQVGKFIFADGTILTPADIEKLITIPYTDGDDILKGTHNIEYKIFGGAGNDKLYGYYKNDILDGGTGDDYLQGGYGMDTYIWGIGGGNDTIVAYENSENASLETVKFSEGITIDSLEYIEGAEHSLVLRNKETGETLTLNNHFSSSYYQVGKFIFADGTILTPADIEKLITIPYTDGNDILKGTHNIEYKIFGGAGNDKLYGYYKNDILDGGTGDDYLQGGYGMDTYIWGIGGGNDTIVAYENSENASLETVKFSEGITIDSLEYIEGAEHSLVLRNKETGETLTLNNHFSSSYYQVGKFIFADGTILTPADIEKLITIPYTDGDDILKGTHNIEYKIFGGAGNDKLYGYYKNDILDGGTGDDYLQGGYGMDTYIWGIGSGNDTIVAYENSENASLETVKFGEGITTDSLEYIEGAENSLVLRNKKTGDTLTLKNHFTGSYYQVGKFIFADGTVLTPADIEKLITIPYTDGDDILKGTHNIEYKIFGGAGNDKLYGYYKNDILDGGTGDDYLQGGYGMDTYIWGIGGGNDTIVAYENSENASLETVKFGEGITIDSLEYIEGAEHSLLLRNKETGETLTLNNHFSSSYYQVGKFIFADGTVLTPADIEKLITIPYTDGDDILKGTHNIEYKIFGGAGNDKLYGYYKNDILDGGTGDDYLQGGYGMDTYIWGIGSGNDTIVAYENSENASLETVKFGEGITTDSLEYIEGAENSLVLRNKKTGDTLTLKNHFTGSYYQVGKFIFADGTVLTPADIEKLITIPYTDGDDILTGTHNIEYKIFGGAGNDQLNGYNKNDILQGGAGNDKLYGNNGDDILDGGTGDDYLRGGYGSDTYIWGKGSGNDTIVVYESSTIAYQDTLQLGEGITKDSLEYIEQGLNLVLRNRETLETLTIKDHFDTAGDQVGKIIFADGTILTAQQITELATLPAMTAVNSFRAARSVANAALNYDPAMQQILFSCIAFDGDTKNLGSAEMSSASNMSINNSDLTFTYEENFNSNNQLNKYIETKK